MVHFLLVALALIATPSFGQPEKGFQRTEDRADCAHYTAIRQPFFGDLHVHTAYSFDSYTSNQRNGPRDAYAYAKGEPILLPDVDGAMTVEARIRRPLDFTSVTDHAEFLGQLEVCKDNPWSLAYWTPLCILTRSEIFYAQLTAASWWVDLGVAGDRAGESRAFGCSLPGSDCEALETDVWTDIQAAAEEHYDRSAVCGFTTFVGYEYTDAPRFKNLHRNVIFRNDRVLKRPVSTYDTGARNFPELWRRLRRDCTERPDGCDVMSIPHNPNLAGGLMFPDPANAQEAQDRLFFEPVTELVQHKASSECRFDRLAGRGVGTEDELCTFEQNRTDNLSSLGVLFGERQIEEGAPVAIEDFGRRNMMRNVLKDGLTLGQASGTNPFRMGFIGSTDTHSATPGATMEDDYRGHLGRRDTGYRNVQDHFEDNPGGHAVVWAEENSRDALFAAIRRKETYATSGTRPVVRFFGGWSLPDDLCTKPDLATRGYRHGVPMGGDLTPTSLSQSPTFVAQALKDPGTPKHPGTDLERIQIIKGWTDEEGRTFERVFDIAGAPSAAAGVDPLTCEPVGQGHQELCAVWSDPSFDPKHPAFYYLRVLENPSCRWSTRQCQNAGVNPFAQDCAARAAARTAQEVEQGARGDVYGKCCQREEQQPFYEPLIQERAWTSSIWYTPAS